MEDFLKMSFAIKNNKEFLSSVVNEGGKDTSGSQVFITAKPTHLNGHDVGFRQVISGLEVKKEREKTRKQAQLKYGYLAVES